jgi:hydrogenase expression/formation protein HypD
MLVALASGGEVTIAMFGDLMRVPGTSQTPAAARAAGADIRVVLSAHEALELAASDSTRKVVFAAIGFETTAPGTAVALSEAHRRGLKNFFVLNAHKVMPPAMEMLLREGARIDGFICPGHVAVITGSSAFDFIPRRHRLACVVTGFEPADLMLAVLMLVRQVNSRAPRVETEYLRAVTPAGNARALGYMNEFFEPGESEWRGLGIIPEGGLTIRRQYRRFDAGEQFTVSLPGLAHETGCRCGEILRGLITPPDCPLFGGACTPENPEGACMVSEEGACNTWYKYHSHE